MWGVISHNIRFYSSLVAYCDNMRELQSALLIYYLTSH